MKKFIYTVLALVLVALVGCNGRAKDEVRVYPESAPEKLASLPEFKVTWSYMTDGDTATYDGVISFAKCEVDSIIKSAGKDNVAYVLAKCEALDIDAKCVVNVVHAGDDIIFSNQKSDAGSFGYYEEDKKTHLQVWYSAPVYGRVTDAYGEPKVMLYFKYDKKVNKKAHTFEFLAK